MRFGISCWLSTQCVVRAEKGREFSWDFCASILRNACILFRRHCCARLFCAETEEWNEMRIFELFISTDVIFDVRMQNTVRRKWFDILLWIWIGWHLLDDDYWLVGKRRCIHRDHMIHLPIVCHESDWTIWLHGRRYMIFSSSIFPSLRAAMHFWRASKRIIFNVYDYYFHSIVLLLRLSSSNRGSRCRIDELK